VAPQLAHLGGEHQAEAAGAAVSAARQGACGAAVIAPLLRRRLRRKLCRHRECVSFPIVLENIFGVPLVVRGYRCMSCGHPRLTSERWEGKRADPRRGLRAVDDPEPETPA